MTFGTYSQSFIYGGYRIGKYFSAEPLAQNYAAKFNAGWEFETDGDPIPLFFPGDDQFEITNYMEWKNLPSGINIGMYGEVESNFGIGFGFQQLGQKSSGERMNLTTNSPEKFTIQSQATTLSFTVGYNIADLITPFVGFEFGRYTFRYSYQSEAYDINKQRLGYNVRLFGSTQPGDKMMCMALNYGFYLTVIGVGNVKLRIAPQYQGRLDLLEGIYMGLYKDKIFKHDNFSAAILLTYDFE